MRAKGVSENDVYEVFGRVDKNGKFLGGHGWAVIKNKLGEGWRLYESTLDIPLSVYPKVEDIRKPVTINGIKYTPEMIFNDKHVEYILGRNMLSLLNSRKHADRIIKHFEIADALTGSFTMTKVFTCMNMLARLRYRKIINRFWRRI